MIKLHRKKVAASFLLFFIISLLAPEAFLKMFAKIGSVKATSSTIYATDDTYVVSVVSIGVSSGTSYTFVNANQMYGSVFTSPNGTGVISNIIWYGRANSGTGHAKAFLVLKSDLSIVATSNAVTTSTSQTEYTCTFSSPPTFLANTQYVLMLIFDVATRFFYGTGTTNQGYLDATNSYASPSAPADATNSNDQYRIRATCASVNYDASSTLEVYASSSLSYYTFLKFDVSTLSSSQGGYQLKLTSNGGGGTYFAYMIIYLYSVTDDTWAEAALTWETKPPGITQLATSGVVSSGQTLIFKSSELDTFINSQIAGDDTASFVLTGYVATSSGYITFYRQEDGAGVSPSFSIGMMVTEEALNCPTYPPLYPGSYTCMILFGNGSAIPYGTELVLMINSTTLTDFFITSENYDSTTKLLSISFTLQDLIYGEYLVRLMYGGAYISDGVECAISPRGWLIGFNYRKLIIINGTSSDVTGYQFLFLLRYGSGTDSGRTIYLENHSQTSFADVRFTNEYSNVSYYYWVEKVVSSAYAYVWVAVSNEVEKSPAQTAILLYYGNSTCASDSSGSDTFDVFDHFDLDYFSLGITKWTVDENDYGGYSISSSMLKLDGVTGYSAYDKFLVVTLNITYYYDYLLTPYIALRVYLPTWTDASAPAGNNHWAYWGMNNQTKITDITLAEALGRFPVWFATPPPAEYKIQTFTANSPNGKTGITGLTPYNNATMEWRWDADRVSWYKFDTTESIPCTTVTYIPDEGVMTVQFAICMPANYGNPTSTTEKLYVDWCLIRQYVYPEPYVDAVLAEEEFSYSFDFAIYKADGTDVLATWDFVSKAYERWLFVNSIYKFVITVQAQCGYEYLDTVQMKFNDSYHTIQLSYDYSTEKGTVVNGSSVIPEKDVVTLIGATAETISWNTSKVTFSLLLKTTLYDAKNRDPYLRMNESLIGYDTGWDSREYHFNVYNLGAFSYDDFVGSAGRTTAEDVYNLYVGGGYVPADVFEEGFEGSEIGSYWDVQEFVTANDIGITTYPYVYGYANYRSAYITCGSNVISPYMSLVLGPQTEPFSFQTYVYMSSAAAGLGRVYVLDSYNCTAIAIYFGYGADIDGVYAVDNDVDVYLDEDYVADTWYNLTLAIDPTTFKYSVYWDGSLTNGTSLDFYNTTEPYNRIPFSFKYTATYYGSAGRTMNIDEINLWREFSGGYAGTAQSMVVYKMLQHVSLQFSVYVPDGDFILHDQLPNNVYVEVIMDHAYGNTYDAAFGAYVANWTEGWKVRITPLDGKANALQQYVSFWVEFYYKDEWKSGRELYVWWEGVDSTVNDKFSLRTDLWFALTNYSTTWGARVSPVYYGVEETTNAIYRFFWGSVWGIMGQQADRAYAAGSLTDADDDIISCREFPLMRIRVLLHKNDEFSWSVKLSDFDTKELRATGDTMQGIATPLYIDPLMPKVSGGGVLGGVIAFLAGIATTIGNWFMANVWPFLVQIAMWLVTVGWTVFAAIVTFFLSLFGINMTFDELAAAISAGLANFAAAILTFFSIIAMIFQFIVGPVVQIFYALGLFLMRLLSFWTLFIGLFTGTNPYTHDLIQLVQQLPFETMIWLVVIFYVIWILETAETKGVYQAYQNASLPFRLLLAVVDIIWKVILAILELIPL